ncbi:hypothetical protein KUV44_08865 [Marinobacter daepoensis]|uniref:Uncharacterized protein n=1 Tax=Marinobacter daepoensis TaxID=262077 RepID=A0ABS3B9H6_9GAMM|nr:hypothetical protein [Marinobacter daepoensis]MBN7768510.1 hypothetical protein [Marinobacter daepoensis]MBY6033038.1 hypothetical protein [Marinobacter daepoensis]MBY6079247.1 hypothetical protein [Marinobacter daepoensis]
MNSATNERNWLFDPSLLKLVHQCRRLIQSEFGVKLHLDEANLATSLATYAGKTRSKHLIQTWEALKQRVPELGKSCRPQEDPAKAGGGKDAPRQRKIIYRGQVVG